MEYGRISSVLFVKKVFVAIYFFLSAGREGGFERPGLLAGLCMYGDRLPAFVACFDLPFAVLHMVQKLSEMGCCSAPVVFFLCVIQAWGGGGGGENAYRVYNI